MKNGIACQDRGHAIFVLNLFILKDSKRVMKSQIMLSVTLIRLVDFKLQTNFQKPLSILQTTVKC